MGVDPSDEASGGSPPLRRMGDFELIRELGRGGMGIIYEARQVSLNRRVALKLLPPGLGMSERAVTRFQREARAAGRLHHTNIVPVYATGEEAGHYYYAMEMIEGQSLAQVLDDLSGKGTSSLLEATVTQVSPHLPEPRVSGPPSGSSAGDSTGSAAEERRWFQTAAYLIAEVADALHYAHGQGILHRDIKPGNLMLSRAGRLCITDFGLARMAQEPAMTMSGLLLGSPYYMSPEQVTAGRTTLDHRTDVYSLGVVLYEMLTLRPPFAGESREAILTAIVTKEPARPRSVNPRVPLDLETICLKAMEKDPDRRYPTAAAMAEDLRRHLHGGLIEARRAGPARRAAKFLRRHPLAATLVLASLGLILAGGYAWRAAARAERAGAGRAFLDAQLAHGRGDHREGLRKVEEAVALEPRRPEFRLLRAELLLSLDRREEATAEADRMVRDDPDSLPAQLILARAATSKAARSERWLRIQERFPPQELETAEAYYLRSFVAEDSATARTLLDRAIDLDPAHDRALHWRASRRLAAKQLAEALADCDRLISARPDSARARRLRAEVLLARGEDAQAWDEIDRAIALDPEDPASFLLRGRLQCRGDTRSLEGAMSDMDEAVRLDPDSAWLRNMRSWCNLQFRRYEEAIADARRAIELGETANWVHQRLAHALHRLGREEEARSALAELERSASGSEGFAAQQALAIAYLQDLEDPASALPAADRAVEAAGSGSTSWLPYATRARVRKALGDEAGTEADCDRIAATELETASILLDRAVELSNICRRYDAAVADLDRAVALAPGWPLAWLERAWAKVRAGRREEGLADYGKAIELAPNWIRARNARASVLNDLNRWEEALAEFDRSIAIEPNRFAICNRLLPLSYLWRNREAREGWPACMASDPTSAVAHANLGTTCTALGLADEAVSHLEKALTIDPNLAYARVGMAAAHAAQGRCDAAAADVAEAQKPSLDHNSKENLVWTLLLDLHYFCPDLGDAALALRYIRELDQDDLEWANVGQAEGHAVLEGIARYRMSDYGRARPRLAEGVEADRMTRLEGLFFLAMAERRLEFRAEAEATYRRALEVLAESGDASASPVVQRIREEAAQLLAP